MLASLLLHLTGFWLAPHFAKSKPSIAAPMRFTVRNVARVPPRPSPVEQVPVTSVALPLPPPELSPPTQAPKLAEVHGRQNDLYFAIDEVDEPSSPVGDWMVDTAALPVGEMYRAELRIWINPQGKIVRSELVTLTPDSEAARHALAILDTTEMRPARLADLPVANLRNIEMLFGRD